MGRGRRSDLATEHWRQARDTGGAIRNLLADKRIWERDLTMVPDLTAQVIGAAATIEAGRLETALADLRR
jgi:hypothetical protein